MVAQASARDKAMTPDQFLDRLKKNGPASAYLFLGPEAYQRERCRKALLDAALPPEDREEGLTRHDLDEIPLASVLDDARSMSLFASKRVIWIASAEAALPRGRGKEEEESGDAAEHRPGHRIEPLRFRGRGQSSY
jgi:DNA polymerase-3 subunit delta